MESEFTTDERDSWYALDEYESALCGRCGQLRSVCSNPDTDWYPQRSICYADAAQSVAWRMFRFKNDPENAGKDHRIAVRPEPDDGLSIWPSTADLTPDDDFI